MKKKILSAIMIIAMMMSMMTAMHINVNALVVDDWEVEISNGEAYIIGYSGVWSDKVTLPSRLGNFNIVGIKGLQFGENVSEIIVPEGYRILTETGAFDVYHRNEDRVLGRVKNRLRKISLPQSLETLAISFEGCTELQEITIPAKVKTLTSIDCGQYSGNDDSGMFANCTGLKNVYLNKGLETIEVGTFANCTALNDFVIPDTVTEIQYDAFKNCDSLVDMIIPDSVVNFGKVTTGTWVGFSYGKVDAVFSDCDNLETIVIGDGVQWLYSYKYMFACNAELTNCPKLKAVYFGKNLKKINGNPVYVAESQMGFQCGILSGASSLKTVIIPDGVEEVMQGFLMDSKNLEAVVIPKSVVSIGRNYGWSSTWNEEMYTDDEIRFVFKTQEVKPKPLPKLYLYGYAGTVAEKYANEEGFPFVDISIATPTSSKVTINGKEVAFTAYNIGGNNYFKLRDVAAALNGTNKNFNVGWDGNNNAISLASKTAYSNVGGELIVNSNATATEPKISNPKIFVDGKLTTFMAFNIADNNYIKLRDLGEVFDFGVEWNDSTKTISINTNTKYKG